MKGAILGIIWGFFVEIVLFLLGTRDFILFRVFSTAFFFSLGWYGVNLIYWVINKFRNRNKFIIKI